MLAGDLTEKGHLFGGLASAEADVHDNVHFGVPAAGIYLDKFVADPDGLWLVLVGGDHAQDQLEQVGDAGLGKHTRDQLNVCRSRLHGRRDGAGGR